MKKTIGGLLLSAVFGVSLLFAVQAGETTKNLQPVSAGSFVNLLKPDDGVWLTYTSNGYVIQILTPEQNVAAETDNAIALDKDRFKKERDKFQQQS